MKKTSPEPRGLLVGIKEFLDESLGAKLSTAKLCTKGSALALGRGDRPALDLERVVEAMWKQIATNWVEGGCQWRGNENWRWALRTNLDVKKTNPSREVRLNRTLARALSRTPNKDRWANEIPTGSGLVEEGGTAPGGLDFAYHCSPDRMVLIELKNNANTDNPVSAAFQVVIYALVLTLARLVHARLRSLQTPITISDKWRLAKHADLRVIEPTSYYTRYPKLGWFEDRLNTGIAAFGARQDIAMSFAFRRFDEEPTDELQLLAALERKVEWH